MNITVTSTLPACTNLGFSPPNPADISSAVYGAFVSKIAINVLTCPFIVLLNILVILAVKTKRELRTRSNIALACLATTDLVVGLIVQPLEISSFSLMLKDDKDQKTVCTVSGINKNVSAICVAASLLHLLLLSGERFLAIKHPFLYESGLVTEARVLVSSVLAWLFAFSTYLIQHIFNRIRVLLTVVVIPTLVGFNVLVYREVRRNQEQIIANQVSLEAKEKLLKDRKAFNITCLVLMTILLCYIPAYAWIFIAFSFEGRIPSDIGNIVSSLITSLLVLNSLLNPLIYTVRIRSFRVAFIQMLSRKTLGQAEEFEQRIFGSNRVAVETADVQTQNRAGAL